MDPAEEVEGLLNSLQSANPVGFAIGLHVSFTTSKFLFQTYRKDWMEEYSRRGFIMRDPTVAWGLSNDGWVRWSDLTDSDQDGVLEAAKPFGLVYGVTIAMTVDDAKSIGSFANTTEEFSDEEIQGFEDAIRRMHELTGGETLTPDREKWLRQIAISSTHS